MTSIFCWLLNTIFAVTYALFNEEEQLSQAPMGKCGADSGLTTQYVFGTFLSP